MSEEGAAAHNTFSVRAAIDFQMSVLVWPAEGLLCLMRTDRYVVQERICSTNSGRHVYVCLVCPASSFNPSWLFSPDVFASFAEQKQQSFIFCLFSLCFVEIYDPHVCKWYCILKSDLILFIFPVWLPVRFVLSVQADVVSNLLPSDRPAGAYF